MIINLDNFVKNAYGVELENYLEPSKYSFYYTDARDIYNFDIYCEEFIKKNPEYRDTDKEILLDAANIRYEYSYIDEYYLEVRSEIQDKIERDIENLMDFFNDEYDDIYVDGNIEVNEINFSADIIEFTGKNVVDKLASLVINCINGYGRFHYDSLEDFYEANSAYSEEGKIDTIESHAHWLNYMEEIYGTVFNFFRVSFDHIDRYGSLGDYEFTVEDVEEAMERKY